MSDFKVPPISTLSGSSLFNFIKALRHGPIDKEYFWKVLLSGTISTISSPFQLYEKLRDLELKRIESKPVFILGHWRSGTTHLHNILCQAPDNAYITTYQSVFPNNLYSKWVFKTFMQMNMPKKRPSDNVELNANFPQEDEFALGNQLAPSFYYFFYFPSELEKLYKKTVLFETSGSWQRHWERSYSTLMSKAVRNTTGNRIIVKNPVNTARVPKLLEMFPDAQFIHIHRNPVIVYLSTKKFFESLFPTVQLQKTSQEQIKDMVINLYKRVMSDYLRTREQIPSHQLIEIAFEQFEENPLDILKEINDTFKWNSWNQHRPEFEKYLSNQRDYQKNVYSISRKELDQVQSEWDFAFKEFGYGIPQSISIK